MVHPICPRLPPIVTGIMLFPRIFTRVNFTHVIGYVEIKSRKARVMCVTSKKSHFILKQLQTNFLNPKQRLSGALLPSHSSLVRAVNIDIRFSKFIRKNNVFLRCLRYVLRDLASDRSEAVLDGRR